MSLTIAAVHTGRNRTVFGDRKVSFLDITFDSSYPTGGEAITLAEMGMTTEVEYVGFMPKAAVHSFAFDPVNNKILVMTGDGVQVADTTNIATVVVRMMVIGK